MLLALGVTWVENQKPIEKMQMLCIRYEALLDLSLLSLIVSLSITHHMLPKATTTVQLVFDSSLMKVLWVMKTIMMTQWLIFLRSFYMLSQLHVEHINSCDCFKINS